MISVCFYDVDKVHNIRYRAICRYLLLIVIINYVNKVRILGKLFNNTTNIVERSLDNK